MPSRDTIMRWERENEDFATNVARAREAKNEDDIEQLEEINQMVLAGQLEPAAATAVSNNLKWVASRLLKKYADRTTHAGDPEAPIKHDHSIEVAFVNTNRDS